MIIASIQCNGFSSRVWKQTKGMVCMQDESDEPAAEQVKDQEEKQ
jgi:hypothetical protein